MSERPDRLARNEAMFRSVNECVEEVVQPGAEEEIDFLCECGDSGCVEKVTLTRREYEQVRAGGAQFAVYQGHEIPEIEEVVLRAERFFVVRSFPTRRRLPKKLILGRSGETKSSRTD